MDFIKLGELAQAIYDAANIIITSITEIKKIVAPEVEAKIVKESASMEVKPSISLEQLRGYLSEMSRDGMTASVKSLLQEFGVDRLSKLNPKDYDECYVRAEEIRNASR